MNIIMANSMMILAILAVIINSVKVIRFGLREDYRVNGVQRA